jgi:hypothetical protein
MLPIMKRFDDLDLDKNGVLTGDELEGLLQARAIEVKDIVAKAKAAP